MSFHKVAPVKHNRKPAAPKQAARRQPAKHTAPAAKATNSRPVSAKGGKGC
ncbi:hypothetical protein AB5J56_24340 [Streptomyces sp. R21]|uniref:Uncharacterized protein n=1 Tax=Streptomyces sp. R21 TaxID=3238627 RepID=A0AB39PCY0_9ACTN